MTKSFLMSAFASALFALSCAGGQTTGTTGTGGGSGSSGGSTGSGGGANSSGGATVGSGGSSATGTGGARSGGSSGSGGSTGSGTGGSSATGSGGATGAGTGGGTGTGTGGTPGTPGAITLTAGYASNGTWKGYAYSFVGPETGSKATITPTMFAAATAFCGEGMITADTTYASVAGMGFNIAQEVATSAVAPPTAAVATTGTGLAISVTATGLTLSAGGSQLRAQVKTAAGDYCANIPAATAMIPWTMFNKTCWDTTAAGAAAFTAGTAITAVELIIPSSGSATVGPFKICLLDAKPY